MKQMSIFDYNKKNLSVQNIDKPALLRDIPYDKIYEAARKEASRKKPAFFVHKYFARRITCNFRMMLLGALLPYDEDIWNYFYDSFDSADLEDLVILDPFMGGGTTLFESIRLNAKTIGNDLQPLSKFVSTALIKSMDVSRVKLAQKQLEQNVAQKIKHYYQTTCPCCNSKADIMYTFHVKKVRTKSACYEHKLFTSFVLSLKGNEFTLVCPECGDVFKHNFKENGTAICKCGFHIDNPNNGYIQRGVFKCNKCKEEKVISDFTHNDGYPFTTEQIAIEYYCPSCKSHDYKRIEEADLLLYQEACQKFEQIKDTLPIPNQDIPEGYNTNQIRNHGYQKFSDLFNKRQLLCLGMLMNEINDLNDKDAQFWLQLAFSGMLEMNNMFCRYQANAYKICNIFFNHAYVPIAMPVENNVWGSRLGTGNFIKTIDKIIRGKAFCSEIYDISTIAKNSKVEVEKKYSSETVLTNPVNSWDKLDKKHPLLHCGDSSRLDFIPDNSVSIVLTDPPFGANVMYSELIDFFHSWNYYSSLAEDLGFTSPLSPKSEEIIVNPIQGKTQADYESGLVRVFSECCRKLKDNGLLIFSFHDRSIDSWLSILNSIDKSGFVLTKSYPLHAETRTGAHTSNKNSIALDIMLICKKKNSKTYITFDDSIKKDLLKSAYEETENIIQRLHAIKAEITIPDIENIFISTFYSLCYEKNYEYTIIKDKCLNELKDSIHSLSNYFSNYDISNRRNGWWSDLYREKWEV